MRTVGTTRALAALALAITGGVGLLTPPALAAHAPTAEQVVALAGGNPWNMGCEAVAGSVECTAADFDSTWFERASIRPAAGPLTGVDTSAIVFAAPLEPYFRDWHAALQGVGCAPDRVSGGQLAAFVADVGSRTAAGDATPVTIPGECGLSGGLRVDTVDGRAQYTYWIRSVMVPTATPTPSPTPRPTPSPTSRPTPSPDPTVTLGSPSPSSSISAPIFASGSATPTASASGGSASATATATPEQQVLGGNPTASPPPGGAAPVDPGAAGGASAFRASVIGPAAVSLDPAALGLSAALALLLLLFMAFAGELFNSTLEGNYDEVAGWFAGFTRPIRRLAVVWRTPVGLVGFVGAGALVYALLDPGLRLDGAALATYAGLLIGLMLVLVSFELPGFLLYRRLTGDLPSIRALPWTLPVAACCVALSRIGELQPAYLYGILLGLVFARELTPEEEGRQAAAGALWTLVMAVLAWIGLEWVRSGGLATDGFAALIAETALAVAVVGGLEAVAFGLLPMRFLAGGAIYRWSRFAWAVLLGVGLVAFLHILVGPHAGYLAELDPVALARAGVAFVAFGAASVLFWAYFRFRPARTA